MSYSKGEVQQLTRRVMARAVQRRETSKGALESIVRTELPDDDEATRKLRDVVFKRILASLEDPEAEALVTVVPGVCSCAQGEEACHDVCAVGAISRNVEENCEIDPDLCVDCGLCAEACESGALTVRSQCLQLAEMLEQRKEKPVYAILAPSFIGQFGAEVSAGQVKGGLRRLGFTDVYEVALAADIITVMEAEEYIERCETGQPFMITSCCCPAFIKLVEKHREEIAHLVSEAVSPMIALGRLLKRREPQCRVVFIGPCLAKRSEAKRPELAGAIDIVLTYKETAELFHVAGIRLEEVITDAELRDASHDGRIYAHTGGVTHAIVQAIKQKHPEWEIQAAQGNGIKECNRLLGAVEAGEAGFNFLEGMGCPGGCVGGPGTIIPAAEGTVHADRFAGESDARHARDNRAIPHWYDFDTDPASLLSPKVALPDPSRLTQQRDNRLPFLE